MFTLYISLTPPTHPPISPFSQKNHYGRPDVALFDFTSIYQAEYAARAVCRGGRDLFLCLVGDALLEVCLLLPPSPPSLHTFVYSSTHHNQSSCSPHLHTHSFSFMDVDLNFFPIFTQSHSLIRCNHFSPALSLHTAILADRYGMSQRIPQCYGHSMAHPRTGAEAPCAGPSEREGIHLSAPPTDNP